uniref:U40-Nephitoxin-Nsp1a_1 n=1 Tax=Nephila sp. SGP-2016 TaxID=1905176 RepID=A0A4Q8K9X0_9ARAC
MILIFMVLGARAVISFCIRSAIPGYMVVPPERTVLAYKSLRISMSHFMMELNVVSWIPQDSIPKKDGWKRASGQRNLSLPMVMTCPSGNS